MRKRSKKTASNFQRNLALFVIFEIFVIGVISSAKLVVPKNNTDSSNAAATSQVVPNDSNSPSHFKATTTVTPQSASPGQKVIIETKVTSDISQKATILLGINNPKLNHMIQLSGDPDVDGKTIDFQPGKTYTYQINYTVPKDAAAGTYVVKESIQDPDGFHDYYFRPEAASFQIESSK